MLFIKALIVSLRKTHRLLPILELFGLLRLIGLNVLGCLRSRLLDAGGSVWVML